MARTHRILMCSICNYNWETKLKEWRKSQKIICGIWTPPAHGYIVVVDPLWNMYFEMFRTPGSYTYSFKVKDMNHEQSPSSWWRQQGQSTPRPTWTMARGIGVIGVAAKQQRFLWIFVYGCLYFLSWGHLSHRPTSSMATVGTKTARLLSSMPLAHILPRPCHGVLDQCIAVI